MQISNAREIVLHQNQEWSRMMSDESERQSLLRYGMMLIAISYAFLFVLSFAFTMLASLVLPFSAVHLMTSIIVEIALSIASLYFVPQILGSLAPSFGGQNNQMNALKLFIFASTPAWLGMSVGMVPIFGWLAAIAGAVFAIYLFWQHFAEAMSIPEDKKVGYVVVAVIILALVNIVTHSIGAFIANMVSPISYHGGMY